MTITIEISKLSEMLFTAANSGAKRALEEIGVASTTITLSEVKKLHKGKIASAARMSSMIHWMPMASGGRTSGVYCKRAEFDKFLFERKFSFNS